MKNLLYILIIPLLMLECANSTQNDSNVSVKNTSAISSENNIKRQDVAKTFANPSVEIEKADSENLFDTISKYSSLAFLILVCFIILVCYQKLSNRIYDNEDIIKQITRKRSKSDKEKENNHYQGEKLERLPLQFGEDDIEIKINNVLNDKLQEFIKSEEFTKEVQNIIQSVKPINSPILNNSMQVVNEEVKYLKQPLKNQAVFSEILDKPDGCYYVVSDIKNNSASFDFILDKFTGTIAYEERYCEVCDYEGNIHNALEYKTINKGNIEKQPNGTWKVTKKLNIKITSNTL